MADDMKVHEWIEQTTESWPDEIKAMIPSRIEADSDQRAAAVRLYAPRVEAKQKHEQQQKEKQEKAAAHEAAYNRDRAKINGWKENYRTWQEAYRNGDKSQPQPERPTDLELYWPGDEFEKVDGRKASTEAPRDEESFKNRAHLLRLKENKRTMIETDITPQPTVNGYAHDTTPAGAFRGPGTALGPVEELPPLPEGQEKSMARRRRERLRAEDVTTRKPLEMHDETVYTLSWGMVHRQRFREELQRTAKGAYSMDGEPLDTGKANSIAAALFGIEGESGAPLFALEDGNGNLSFDLKTLHEYREHPEDGEFLAACVWAVYEANPKVWLPEDVKAAREAAAGTTDESTAEAANDAPIETAAETKEEALSNA